MADSKKYDGSQWQHSLRKLTTATEAVENPLYSDGTAITAYTIKGNTVQNGTPSPSNPVDVNGVGVRTENLFDGQLQQGYYAYATGDYTLGDNYVCTHLIPCTENTTYTFRCINASGGSKNYGYVFFDSAQNRIGSDYINELTEGDVVTYTATTPQNTAFLAINVAYGRRAIYVHPSDITDFMLNTGSTAKPYEPYGYKIPISSGGVTTNIYLGSTQTTRQIGKYIFDGSNIFTSQRSTYRNNTALFATTAMAGTGVINRPSMNNYFVVPSSGINPQTLDYACSGFHPSDQFSSYYYLRVPYDVIGMTDSNTDNEFITALNTWLSSLYNSGNPMIAYYALANPETATVNEPLMKIGTYADTLSNAASIPTTEGANSITVDTTVQPSEFTATWTGWHNASVKEWNGSQWNE